MSRIPADVPALLTTSEAADLMRVAPRTVTRWANANRLPSYKLGRRVLFDARDVARFMQEQRQEARR